MKKWNSVSEKVTRCINVPVKTTIQTSLFYDITYHLFRYLQEIGYTDTIIDVRSNRVRSLLGLNNDDVVNEENQTNLAMNGENNANNNARKSQHDGSNRRGEEIMMDTEAAVMANFDFLSSEVRK